MANLKLYKNQNYEQLQSMHSCDDLFEDPYFPADDSSLFTRSPLPAGICWMRPHVVLCLFKLLLNHS